MKILLDANGVPVLRSGKLVLVDDANKEIEVDPVSMYQTNGRLFGEAKQHREAKEAAEAKLASYAGIEDPKAALEALNKVKTLGTKENELAQKIEEVRTETTKALELKYKPIVDEAAGLKGQLSSLRLGNAFANSEFVKSKLNIPADMVQTHFGSRFAEKDGKLVPVDEKGNPLYSVKNPGNVADFEEGIEMVVNSYAHKGSILKGSGANGGGTHGGGGGGNGANGKPVMTRAQFDALDPAGKAAAAAKNDIVD